MTMLDSMRRHKNWLKWSLALVVLAFIALYFPSYMDTGATIGAPPSDVVATVNGTDIRGVDFQQRRAGCVDRSSRFPDCHASGGQHDWAIGHRPRSCGC